MNKHDKWEAVRSAGKSLHFLQQLKKHVQIGSGFTQDRAAYGLKLIDEYLCGKFLEDVQLFKGKEDG